MIIRSFLPTDSDCVSQVALAAFAQYQGFYKDWDVLVRGVGAMASLADSGEIIVAENKGTIVGAVAYIGPGCTPRADFFATEWPIVRMLVVDPSERGKGIGRKLMHKCVELAREDCAQVLSLHTSPIMEAALSLYTKMGFKLEFRVPDRFGVPYSVYLLQLG